MVIAVLQPPHEPAHAVIVQFGHDQLAKRADGDVHRHVEARVLARPIDQSCAAVAGEGGDLPIGGDPANPTAAMLGHEDDARGVHVNAHRLEERRGAALTVPSPFATASDGHHGAVHAHATDRVVGDVGEPDLALRPHGNPAELAK